MLESLLNKVAGQRACNFIKMRIQHRCFQVKFLKFLATPFFYKTAPVAASVCKSDSQILELSYKQEKHVRIFLYKSLFKFGMVLKESATHHKEKSEILLVTRPPTCFLILVCEKGQK